MTDLKLLTSETSRLDSQDLSFKKASNNGQKAESVLQVCQSLSPYLAEVILKFYHAGHTLSATNSGGGQ